MHALVLGIDGLDYNLLMDALPDMPFFCDLMAESAWGMMVPDVALSPQSWTTIFTGVSERRHHVVNFSTPLSRVVRVPTLWSIFNAYDMTVGLMNVPMTYPPATIKGYMVAGQPRPYPASRPMGIVTEPFPSEAVGRGNTFDRHEWAMKEGLRLAQELRPDVAVIATMLADEFGHGWNARWAEGRQWILENIYPRLDEACERLAEELQPEVLAVFSDHGWNSQEFSETLYNPWYEGMADDSGHVVDEANWAWHTKEGLAFWKGPNVVPGELEPFSNRDWLPTMIDVAGVGWIADFDGESVVGFKYEAGDAAAIEKRLKGLGYVS